MESVCVLSSLGILGQPSSRVLFWRSKRVIIVGEGGSCPCAAAVNLNPQTYNTVDQTLIHIPRALFLYQDKKRRGLFNGTVNSAVCSLIP